MTDLTLLKNSHWVEAVVSVLMSFIQTPLFVR